MDPRSQVILRQCDYFDRPVLLAGLPADDLLASLPNALGWSWLADEYAVLQQRFGGRCHFGIEPPENEFSAALLFMPKAMERTSYLLSLLAAQVETLYLVGEKRGGIERAGKLLSTYGPADKLDSARHCQLWRCEVRQRPDTPDLQTQIKRYHVPFADSTLNIISLPGVFSHGRLDAGTALLLDCLDDLPEGFMLDFGCGAGILGVAMKRRYPASQLVMMDVDAFALESTRLTLMANHMDANVIAGEGIASAPSGLSAIVTNPPFHQGVHTDYRATETLLLRASQHLALNGELRLVANSFLKYPSLIESQFGHCHRLAEREGFSVYSARV